DVAAGAGSVLHDDRLAPNLREPVGDDPGGRVRPTARREPDQKTHHPGRPDLSPRGARERRQCDGAGGEMQKLTSGEFHRDASTNPNVKEACRCQYLLTVNVPSQFPPLVTNVPLP